MPRKLTDDERRQRNRDRWEEGIRREAMRDAKRALRREQKAESIEEIVDGSAELRASRRYRRQHLRAEWLFAKGTWRHKEQLASRRRASKERMLGHVEDEEETRSTRGERLYARDLLPNLETVVERE